MRRYALRDDQWDRIKDFLPGAKAMSEARRRTTTVRRSICTDRTGIPWRDLPERFGDPLIDTLTERGIDPVIPQKANRKNQRACDYPLYCERNLIERFFNKLKRLRAIATRCDKLAGNFLAGIQLACAIILLN